MSDDGYDEDFEEYEYDDDFEVHACSFTLRPAGALSPIFCICWGLTMAGMDSMSTSDSIVGR